MSLAVYPGLGLVRVYFVDTPYWKLEADAGTSNRAGPGFYVDMLERARGSSKRGKFFSEWLNQQLLFDSTLLG